MRILVLEDDAQRIVTFKRKFIGHTVDITDNPQEANTWLEENSYNAIFLDHDLADKHYAQDTICDKTTGLCTAKYLGERPHLSSKAQIIIHSCNPNGAKRMKMACRGRKVHLLPFTQFERIIVS